ncbi:unnamed protein product, partial [Phaeothamnion confervicola]
RRAEEAVREPSVAAVASAAAPAPAGDFLSAIREGAKLKKVEPKAEPAAAAVANPSLGALANPGINDILARRKYLEAESDESDSDDSDWEDE